MPFSKRPSNLLLRLRRSSAFFILLFCLLTSCRKHMSVPSPASFQVRIDSVGVIGFNHIKVSASYSSADLSPAVRLGVCWGTTSNPVVGKDTISQSRPDYNYLDTLISSLDSNTIYHLRAFCIRSRDTIYSADTSVKTGALELTLLQQFSTSNNLELRQVASLGSTGYLVLSQVDPQFSGFPWSNLTRIDSSGNRLWSMDYDVDQDKRPSQLLAVPDGFIFAADSLGYGTNTPVLYKTDLNGNLLWETDLSAGSSWSIQRPVQLIQAVNSSDVILSVVTINIVGDTGVVDGPLFRFQVDQNGNLQTTSQLAGLNFAELALMTPAASGGSLGIFWAGPADEPTGIDFQLLTTNYVPEWSQTYYRGGPSGLDPISCLQDSKGNYTLLTWIDAGYDSTWLLGIDGASGNALWQATFPGSPYAMAGDNFPSAFTLSPSDNYYVTGGNFILKTDATGNYIWDFSTVSMKLASAGAIFVSSGNVITVIGTAPAGMLTSGVIDGLFFYKMQEY